MPCRIPTCSLQLERAASGEEGEGYAIYRSQSTIFTSTHCPRLNLFGLARPARDSGEGRASTRTKRFPQKPSDSPTKRALSYCYHSFRSRCSLKLLVTPTSSSTQSSQRNKKELRASLVLLENPNPSAMANESDGDDSSLASYEAWEPENLEATCALLRQNDASTKKVRFGTGNLNGTPQMICSALRDNTVVQILEVDFRYVPA